MELITSAFPFQTDRAELPVVPSRLQDPPAFVVIEDGHRCEIFRDGRVTGFSGDSVIISNNIPMYENAAIQDYKRAIAAKA